ncbi:MAG: hypothetical protein KDC10_16100, partial [Calditrichaeota bacterium]|nr:hypothetical protein [Calditrichota bacterium]
FWRGQGHQDSNSGYHIRAGAVQMVSGVSAVFEDVVFADCRAPRRGSILFHGVYNSANYSTGSLILRRVHCRGTEVGTTELWPDHAFQIHATQSQVIVDGFYWDGGGTDCPVLKQFHFDMDSLALSNVRIVNCTGVADLRWTGFTPTNNSSMSNIYSEGCYLSFRNQGVGTDGSTMVVRNVEITGCDSTIVLYATPREGTVLFDSLHVHHNRMKTDQASMININSLEDRGHLLRNLNFHDNIQCDSTSAAFNRPHPFISLTRCDLINASIRNNAVIMAPDPDVGDTPGHAAEFGAMVSVLRGSRRIENVLFENNRVDDLDVYTQTSPLFAPTPNMGRELYVEFVDTLVIRGLTVRNSRMANPIPEVVASDGVGISGPGNAVVLLTRYTDAKGVLFENCDDGGLFVGGGLLLEGAIFRNVKRAALFFGTAFDGSSDGDKVLRNIHVENLVGGPSWLSQEDLRQGRQSFITTLGQYYGAVPPGITLENVTVTGSSNIPYLFNALNPTNLIVHNSIVHGNEYETLMEHDQLITQNWNYNIIQEPVPGIGNQVGVNPLFDEELGAPWLSPISPAIDAGHPDESYDDIEDPDNPGFARWPSQGTPRNDIGYTGGP